MPHTDREIAVGSFYEKMIMIVHEAVGVTEPVVAFIDKGKDFEKCLSILVVFEYGLFIISPRGDVIDGAEIFYAKGTGHDATIA